MPISDSEPDATVLEDVDSIEPCNNVDDAWADEVTLRASVADSGSSGEVQIVLMNRLLLVDNPGSL